MVASPTFSRRPEFLAEAGGSRSAWDTVLMPPDLHDVDRYLALDTATYLPGDLLLKVDRMSMAHALEVRSPLLDHEVHAYAAALPGDVKLRRGTTKWLLKQLAARRGLPEHLVNRRKRGFGIPVGEWFRVELRSWIEGVLRDPATHARGYFDADLAGAGPLEAAVRAQIELRGLAGRVSLVGVAGLA